MPRLRELKRALFFGGILCVFSCGGGSDAVTGPVKPPPTGTSIELSESAVTIEIGFSHILTATVKSAGTPVPGATVTWASDNSSVAQVIGGSIIPVSPGIAHITAAAEGKSASAEVTIIPTVVASIGLSRKGVTLAPGRTTQLIATPLDIIERPIPGRVASLSSSDPTIVSASQNGTLTANALGRATVTASLDGKSSTATVLVTGITQISIATGGTLAQGVTPPHIYSITLRDDSDSLTAVSSDGSPATITGQMPLADSVEFVAQADSATSLNWPSRLWFAGSGLPSTIQVAFIPKTFSLTAGTFAGTDVHISIDEAVSLCSVSGGPCANGFYSSIFHTGVTAWRSLPIAVQVIGFSTADSAGIWVALHGLEDALGGKYFVPDDGRTAQRITVTIGLPPEGGGSLGYTFWHWDTAHRMTDAEVSFRFSNPAIGLIQHEFLHALGMGHTCAWATVMGGYGCPMATSITSTDAGYVDLAYSVFRTEQAFTRLPDGTLPCGAMGVWNAATSKTTKAGCTGNNPAATTLARNRLSIIQTTINGDGAP